MSGKRRYYDDADSDGSDGRSDDSESSEGSQSESMASPPRKTRRLATSNRFASYADPLMPIPPLDLERLEEPLSDPEDLLALLSAKQQKQLLTTLLLDEAVRPAVVEAMHPMLADMPSTYAAAVTKELLAKLKNIIGINDHPRAVAPFLEDVENVALELLMVIAQGSVPDWENEWSNEKGRVRFDKAVDDLYVALVKRRREEEGKAFKLKRALKDLRSFAKNMEEFGFSSCFEQSIALLESWTDQE